MDFPLTFMSILGDCHRFSISADMMMYKSLIPVLSPIRIGRNHLLIYNRCMAIFYARYIFLAEHFRMIFIKSFKIF